MIAQLVEQWIEDPRVASSTLALGIFLVFCLHFYLFNAIIITIKINKNILLFFDLASLVQLVERRSPKSDVEGSIPSGRVFSFLGGLKII